MEKRFFLFFILMFLFMLGYSQLLSKFYPQAMRPQMEQSPAPEATSGSSEISEKESPADFTDIKENIREIEMGEYSITISLTGGYIKNITINAYHEKLNFINIGLVTAYRDEEFDLKIPRPDTFILENEQIGIKKIWMLDGFHLTFTLEYTKDALSSPLVLFQNILMTQGLSQRYQEIFYRNAEKSVKRQGFKKVKHLTLSSPALVGARDRYFTAALYSLPGSVRIQRNDKVVTFSSPFSQQSSARYNLFIGPQQHSLLKQYGIDDIIYYGFFHSIGLVILTVLRGIYSLAHNWGVSIVVLSFFVYLLLFPFTMISTNSMIKMQEIQPQIESIRIKYKDNPQKMNKEVMMLYSKNKINPLGSCFPLLFQLPVFLSLYQVLLRFVELKGARFLWIQDLTLPDRLMKLPFTLPFFGEYLNILPLFIILVSFLQQKFATTTTNSQQKSTALFFVLFIGVIFYQFPSCLVLYWLIQNLLTFLYQYRVNKARLALS